MTIKYLAAAIAALGLIFVQPCGAHAGGAQATPVKHIYIMRHLQKTTGEDPPLTEEGKILADMVAGMLGFDDFNIKGVFATKTRRAMQTAQPLADFVKVPVRPYDPRDIAGLVAAVEAVPGSVLVVGHSNTVPDLVAAFGGRKPPPLGEADYGTIYQVAVGSGQVREFFVPPPPRLAAPERGR
jgi:broad specificity phosphatase PhoE